MSGGRRSFGRLRDADVDLAALKLDVPGFQGEQRVVLALPDVKPGHELRPALPDENRAGRNVLAAELLDAAELRVAVPAVAGRALSLLMSHGKESFTAMPTAMSLLSPGFQRDRTDPGASNPPPFRAG